MYHPLKSLLFQTLITKNHLRLHIDLDFPLMNQYKQFEK